MVEKANNRVLERDMKTLADRFDRHLEIYAANGKEMAGLAEVVNASRGDMSLIRESVMNLEGKIEDRYVTSTEFKPIKVLVYGLVGMILTAVVTAGMSFMIITRI